MGEPSPEQWAAIMSMPTRNSGSERYPKMLPATRALLDELYRPFNERLARILQDPRWSWGNASSALSS
jgi:hypothetical protein